MGPVISISPRRTAQVLSLLVLCLTFASIAVYLARYSLGYQGERVIWRFLVDHEGNIPSWYSSATLLLCSILLMVIASAKKVEGDRYTLRWQFLSIIFVYLSLDEAFVIHEMAVKPLRSALNAGGLLFYTWVVPGAAFVLIFGLFYLKFLAALPKVTRRLFLAAGTLFVGGALGVEALGGAYVDLHGDDNLAYAMIIIVEEFLEMAGVVVFIYALLSYMNSYVGDIRIRIDGRTTPAPHPPEGTAPYSADAGDKVHREAHGLGADQIIEVKEGS